MKKQFEIRAEVVQENVQCDLCGKEFYFKHGNVLQSKKVKINILKVFKIN